MDQLLLVLLLMLLQNDSEMPTQHLQHCYYQSEAKQQVSFSTPKNTDRPETGQA
jgi:hypothetical protein